MKIEYVGDKESRTGLEKFVNSKNICDLLEDDQLSLIGDKVVHDYQIDLGSEDRANKCEKWEKGFKIVNQVIEQKNHPFDNASNVLYPLLATAAIQYNAHTLPAIMGSNKPVKVEVVGEDPENKKANQAKNPVNFMNYQLTHEMTEWKRDTDRLVLLHSLYGVMYRKIYKSDLKDRIVTKILTPKELILPEKYGSLEDTPRITEIFYLLPNDIESYIRSGLFEEISMPNINTDDSTDDSPVKFLEQHRWIDLDDDGYKEPYIVTVCEQTSEVARIVANYTLDDVVKNEKGKIKYIPKNEHYIEYQFIESVNGKGLPTGFLDLLYPINEAINTNINQLIDAGTLANSNTGFVGKDAKMAKGTLKLKMGEYASVNAYGGDIRKAIVPINFQGPNQSLFSLLQFLVQSGKELANIKDILTGESYANMPASTTIALIEQGSKVYTSIFGRVYDSLRKEFVLLKKLNALHVSEDHYRKIIDNDSASVLDFVDESKNFVPIADPKKANTALKMAKSQYLMQFLQDPLFDQIELRKRLLDAAEIEGYETLLVKPSNEPDINQQMTMKNMELEDRKVTAKEQEVAIKAAETESKITKNKASAMKDLSDAECNEVGTQNQIYKTEMETLSNGDITRRVGQMEERPSNEGIV